MCNQEPLKDPLIGDTKEDKEGVIATVINVYDTQDSGDSIIRIKYNKKVNGHFDDLITRKEWHER